MMKILVKNNTEVKTLFVDAYRLPQLRFNVFQYKIASKLTSAMMSEAGNHFAKQSYIFYDCISMYCRFFFCTTDTNFFLQYDISSAIKI